MRANLLKATGLNVEIVERELRFRPVDGVSLQVGKGESLALVGESGSGKTLTLKSLLDLLPPSAIASGEILFAGRNGLQPVRPRELRGSGIGMVFQEPMTALNPLLRVGRLITDAYRATHRVARAEAERQAISLLREVGVPAAEERMSAYPHQLSGGLRQRVMIATALATEPQLLLCDEPTTALDVTVQQQILGLLNRIRTERGLALIYVTHDLAVVSDVCERVAVMYAGRIIETGSVDQVFRAPAHPYTAALLNSVPAIDTASDELTSIPGTPPDPRAFPSGCRFRSRCAMAQADCTAAPYTLAAIDDTRATACIHWDRLDLADGEGDE